MKAVKIIIGILGGLIGLALAAVVAVYNIIPTKYGASKVSEFASELIKGELKVEDLDYTFFSSFPKVTVELDNVSLVSTVLEKPDSVLSFKKLYASVDLMEYLKNNKVNSDSISLSDADVLVRIDKNGKLDWQIYESKEEKEDTSATKIPEVFLKSLAISNTRVRYIDERSNRKAEIDSLCLNVKGQYASDIVANMKFRTPSASYRDSMVEVSPLPLAIDADVTLDTIFTKFDVRKLEVSLDDVMLALNGKVKSDTAYSFFDTDLAYNVSIPNVEHLRCRVPAPYDKYVKKFTSGGSIDSKGTIAGLYKADTLPTIKGGMNVRDVWVQFNGKKGKVSANLRSNLCLNFVDKKESYVNIDTLKVTEGTSYVKTEGKVNRLLTSNPYIDIKVALSVILDKLSNAIPKIKDLTYSGNVKADAEARFNLADVTKMQLHKVFAHADVDVSRVKASMPSQGVSLFSKNLCIESGINSMRSKRSNKLRYFVTKMDVDTMFVKYGSLIDMGTKKFNASYTADSVMNHIPFLRGSIRFEGMKAFVSDTMAITGNKTSVSLTMKQDTVDKFVPRLTANIRMDSMMFFTPSNALLTDSLRFKLSIYPRARKFKKVKGERVRITDADRKYVGLDSLGRLLQGVSAAQEPFDKALKSFRFDGTVKMPLVRYATPYFPLRVSMRKLDMSFSDDTIKLNKVKVRAGKSSANLSGKIENFRRYFLRGKTLTADLDLSSKRINFNEFLNASYQGKETRQRMSQMKEAQRMGLIKPMTMTRDRLIRPQVFERGFQQKIEAMRAKRNVDPARKAHFDSIMAKVEEQQRADSAALAQSSEAEDLNTEADFGLLCLPSNLDLTFNAKVDTARFANLLFRDFNGGVFLKNSTLLLKELKTKTNVGNLELDAMYHCNNSNGADVGADIQGSNIDITNLVNTLPEIDSLVPMLRSFQGVVTLDLTAKAALDSAYNLLLPSLSAATVIRGDSLVLMDGETFSEVAKLLLFKKKTKNLIDNISVELLLDNNEMKVLPFMVEMDKYRVAVGGENTLDMNFNYHISVLKSPLPTKLGVNVSGTLDKMKIRLAKCKYKDEKSITKAGQFSNGGVNLRSELQENLRSAIMNAINTYAIEQKNSTSVVTEKK